MKKILLPFLFLFIGLVLSGPSSAAQNFSVQDLDGRWSMHCFGVYDVRGLYYYGTLTVKGGLITGDPGGAHGYAVADFTGGGFNVTQTGEVQGLIEGRSSQGSITIFINLGWMGLDKNQISFIGTDNTGMVLTVALVRIAD